MIYQIDTEWKQLRYPHATLAEGALDLNSLVDEVSWYPARTNINLHLALAEIFEKWSFTPHFSTHSKNNSLDMEVQDWVRSYGLLHHVADSKPMLAKYARTFIETAGMISWITQSTALIETVQQINSDDMDTINATIAFPNPLQYVTPSKEIAHTVVDHHGNQFPRTVTEQHQFAPAAKAQTSGLHVASKEWNTSSHNVLNCIQKALNTYISAEVDLIPINTLNHTSAHTGDHSPQYLIKPKTLMGFIWSLCLTQTNVNISL